MLQVERFFQSRNKLNMFNLFKDDILR